MSESEAFVIEDGVLTAYHGSGGDVVIPEGVTAIGEEAFLKQQSITSVTLPKSLRVIGKSAFRQCPGLTEVTIPAGVERIPAYAFGSCRSLARAELPAQLKAIGNCAFEGCKSLERVTIPDGVESIEWFTFAGCDSLREVTLPEGLKKIGWRAFEGCDRLKCLTIPERCRTLGADFVPPLTAILVSDPSDLLKSLLPNAAAGFAERGGGREDASFAYYARYLRQNAGALVEMSMAHPALLSLMCRERLIPPEHLERYSEAARESGDPSRVAAVLEYGRRIPAAEKERFERELEARRDRVYLRRLARQGRRDAKGLTFLLLGRPLLIPKLDILRSVFRYAGALLATELTEDVDYVVRCSETAGPEIVRRAELLGIEIISEEQMRQLLRGDK